MNLLFGNIFVNSREKYVCFQHTIVKIAPLFSDILIRFRGAYSERCKDFIERNINEKNLQVSIGSNDEDWVLSTLRILEANHSRAIFIYVEDHVLIAEPGRMLDVINDFTVHGLDYLPYSFFKSNRLYEENLLPLEPVLTENIAYFKLDSQKNLFLNQISPEYYIFSLPCICSKKYFLEMLRSEKAGVKIYSKWINRVFCRLLPYPSHRLLYNKINNWIRCLNLKLCGFSPRTPFNLEKLNIQKTASVRDLVIGVPRYELLSSYDDDNVSYSDSAVKRGYLVRTQQLIEDDKSYQSFAKISIHLTAGVARNIKYVDHQKRSSSLYLVSISTKEVKVVVKSQSGFDIIPAYCWKTFYANQDLLITSESAAKISAEIFKVSIYE